ncbi:MAG: succinyl-diaminopimelate desuccinylase [Propionicimonas sp.]|uniref:succinyl-diaminopimelate desuccinylase n=1 Tax=Propionicimonas sp. TaxID=1955623 RepID=UPI002B20350E|nr:succinyl-diaminopimelate desuccinylase [Propionicimonas sp.]MEA4944245.1 succinyl-diaminopimelate desuccinylase [Propionicimonas sp.]MEA5054377.1 succinyl-diaminopimelate desuccinylase [Propionicimonas sp.]
MSLDLRGDLVRLFRDIVDIESVSGHEGPLADAVEAALAPLSHLAVVRDGDTVIARTGLGRDQRVVIAGHLDTVPVAGNLPSRLADGLVHGRGTVDMKGGVAVALGLAAALEQPSKDITWIFYDHEEVAATDNSLTRLAASRPELLTGDFAILMEPTSARVEGGCQGTLRFTVTTRGRAAHSARAWRGHNAIHDAGEVLRRLEAYRPRTVKVDGLSYREGMNAVDIRGGIAGNVIPDSCTVTVNFRFAPDRDEADALAHCRELMDGYDLEFIDLALGARPGLDRPLARDFLAAVGGEPVAKFGWTDVARFSALGVPAVNYGPGDPLLAHADDEACPVTDLYACRDALARWLG